MFFIDLAGQPGDEIRRRHRPEVALPSRPDRYLPALRTKMNLKRGEKMPKSFIAIQGEYRVSDQTWETFKADIRLLALSELLSGLFQAVEVNRDYLETIDQLARPATFA